MFLYYDCGSDYWHKSALCKLCWDVEKTMRGCSHNFGQFLLRQQHDRDVASVAIIHVSDDGETAVCVIMTRLQCCSDL